MLSIGMLKKPWIWSAWMSIVSTRSAPAEIMSATTLDEIETRAERGRRSWRAYPKYGMTAVTRFADARLIASVRMRSSSRFSSTERRWLPSNDAHVGWTTKASLPRTESISSTITSPSLKRSTIALPSGMFRCPTISFESVGLADPANTIIDACRACDGSPTNRSTLSSTSL